MCFSNFEDYLTAKCEWQCREEERLKRLKRLDRFVNTHVSIILVFVAIMLGLIVYMAVTPW